ncbi:MAG: selenobiotic family peptide radical SAM maturase [Deltaproteobacteria bacterium]|nr:selenobiotic family peptide radical SAM maturase [Deltaproteobacteria bacterium]
MEPPSPHNDKKRPPEPPILSERFQKIFPKCCSIMGPHSLDRVLNEHTAQAGPEFFPDLLETHGSRPGLPAFLADLARVEWAFHQARTYTNEFDTDVDALELNPTVQVIETAWTDLDALFHETGAPPSISPRPGKTLVLVWKDFSRGEPRIGTASDEDLLALKMVLEQTDPANTAAAENVPVGVPDRALKRAVRQGILLAPRSAIRRDPACFPISDQWDERFLASPVFTLQWHVTQACDLHCKHCYDRSDRSPMNLERAVAVLDELRVFCKERHVSGQVTFTGGNPLLFPKFTELYRAASERGFVIALAGNVAARERLEELKAIQKPVFYQVSLEGLEEHNDRIRGSGYFRRVMDFLDLLREMDIYSMVMLTLTKDNMDQVLPLAERLRGRTNAFNFNRLSMVGEGAQLELPDREAYAEFLESYVEASEQNPILGLKDNLINILYHRKQKTLFGGCAGYGCGAAFNFVTLLPDGEVHACRKFPSLIGNLFEQSLAEIYDSEPARRYRAGSEGCRSCAIRPVCGGCPAIAYSRRLDVFNDRDPYCFIDS